MCALLRMLVQLITLAFQDTSRQAVLHLHHISPAFVIDTVCVRLQCAAQWKKVQTCTSVEATVPAQICILQIQ